MDYTTTGLILLTVISSVIGIVSGIRAGARIPLLEWAIKVRRSGIINEARAINDKLKIDNFNLTDEEKTTVTNLIMICNMRTVFLFAGRSTFGRFRLWELYESMVQVIQNAIIIFHNKSIETTTSGHIFIRQLRDYMQTVVNGLTWAQSNFITLIVIEIIALFLLSVLACFTVSYILIPKLMQ